MAQNENEPSKSNRTSSSKGKRIALSVIIITSIMFTSVAVSYYSVNAIHIIRPMISVPVIVTPSQHFEVELEFSQENTILQGVEMSLESPYGSFSLGINSLEIRNKKIFCLVAIPTGVLLETLYDLQVIVNGMKDIQFNSVFLTANYNKNFQFIIWSDPQIDLYDKEDPLNTIGNMEAVIHDINVIRPAFVIITGDLTEWGRPDEIQLFKKTITQKLEVPAYIVIGNHDKYSPTAYVQAFRHLTYSFNYGDNHHFTVIDTSANLDALSDETFAFLKNDLEEYRKVPNKYIAMHSPPFFDDPNRNFEHYRKEFNDLCREYDIKAVFFGHEHGDRVLDIDGNDLAFNTSYDDTLFIQTNDGRQDAGYRLITMKNNAIDTYTIQNSNVSYDDFASLTARNLDISYTKPNDGSASDINVSITNRFLFQDFPLLVLRFRVLSPAGNAVIIGTNATLAVILREYPLDSKPEIHDVYVGISASANTTVQLRLK